MRSMKIPKNCGPMKKKPNSTPTPPRTNARGCPMKKKMINVRNMPMAAISGLMGFPLSVNENVDSLDHFGNSLQEKQEGGDRDNCLDRVDGRSPDAPGFFHHLPGV